MARPKKDKQPARLTVTLDESDYQKVCTLADQNDVSAAWVIRRAVHDYLGRVPATAGSRETERTESSN